MCPREGNSSIVSLDSRRYRLLLSTGEGRGRGVGSSSSSRVVVAKKETSSMRAYSGTLLACLTTGTQPHARGGPAAGCSSPWRLLVVVNALLHPFTCSGFRARPRSSSKGVGGQHLHTIRHRIVRHGCVSPDQSEAVGCTSLASVDSHRWRGLSFCPLITRELPDIEVSTEEQRWHLVSVSGFAPVA